MVEREELESLLYSYVATVITGQNRIQYSESSRKLTAHVPENLVFTPKSEVRQQLANAEDWVEKRLQTVLPGVKIRDRLSKRASRRHRGRARNYLN
jgi:predicted metal-dependent hydrolase